MKLWHCCKQNLVIELILKCILNYIWHSFEEIFLRKFALLKYFIFYTVFCSLRCLPSQFSMCLFVDFWCIRAPHYHCGDVSSKNFCPPLSIYLRSICVLLCFLPNSPYFFRGNEWLAVKSTCHVFIVDVTNVLSLNIFQLISGHSVQHNSISSSWTSMTSSCGNS